MPSETGRRDDVSRQIEVHIHRTTQHNNGPERTSLGRLRPCTNFEESRGCGPPFAIFHSQTSFLRRENRKSGACYNKRQYCITQKRARDTGRGTPSLGMQHSAGRSLASRCGIREEEREIQKNFGMARKHAHMVKRPLLCPRRRRRGMHTAAIFLNGDLNVREREMAAGVLPCFPRQ